MSGLVDRAIEHDLQENAHLCAALDDPDPSGDAAPRVHAATRYTVPAAAHATVKFVALAAALPPASATVAVLALRTLQVRVRRRADPAKPPSVIRDRKLAVDDATRRRPKPPSGRDVPTRTHRRPA